MMRFDLHRLIRMLMIRSAAALLAIFLGFAPAFASFDEPGAGARGAGIADAGTAVADDASAPFYNPAGMVQIGDRRLTAEMSQQNRGLSDGSKMGGTHLGYIHPLNDGENILGVGYRSYGVTDLLEERTYLLGAARRMNMERLHMKGILSIGGNVKMLERTFKTGTAAANAFNDAGATSGQVDPVLANGASASAFAVDAGALYQFGPRLNTAVGLAIMNANSPDIGVDSTDKVTSQMKLGIAHRPLWGLISAEIRRAQRLEGKADTDIAFGLERNFRVGYRSALTVRGGYAAGSRDYKAVTAGASYNFGRFAIDYALSFPIGNLSELDGSQRLGVSMRFGEASGEPVRTRYENLDLIRAFESDSLTAHILMTENSNLTPEMRSFMNRLAARRFSLDDPGLSKATGELREALKDGRDWSSVVSGFTRGMLTEDARRAAEALERYVAGDPNTAVARLALLSPEVQKRPSVVSLKSMAVGERAATSFREGNINITLDAVRRLAMMLPHSERVRTALRQLETLQSAPPVQTPAKPEPIPEPVEVQPTVAPVMEPVAPAPLETPVVPPVPTPAPEPVVQPVAPQPVTTPAVAPIVAPAQVAPSIAPKATIAPTAKPTQVQPKAKPTVKAAEVERAWIFYREAVSREVSDHEKIEILEDMLLRYGETEAARINKELERLRTRIGKNGVKKSPNK